MSYAEIGRRLDRGTSVVMFLLDPAAVERRRARYRASPERTIWHGMIHRCYDSTNSSYAHYGARGIEVCQRWLDSFAAFLEDVGPRPGPGFYLERTDNDRGYIPGLVRWTTAKNQARNRRSNRLVEYQGRIMTVAEAAERSALPYGTLMTRLNAGWSPERLFTPARQSVRKAD